MSVKYERSNEKLIVKFSGRLDTTKSIIIGDEIETKLKDQAINYVIFDMKDLLYMSSSGIRILVSTAKEMYKRQGKIEAINYSESIKKILDITEFFSICK